MGGQPLLSKKHLHIFDDLFWFLSPFWDQKYFVGENYSANFVNSFRIKQFFRIIKEKQDTSTLYTVKGNKVWDWFSCTNTHTHSLSRITPRSICHTRQCQDVWILIPINYARRKYIRITVRGHKHTQGVVCGGMMIYTVIKVIKTIESINSTDNHI